MTSRNLFFKLIREDLKRRVWAVCLAFLSFFFMMPVAAAMGISSLNRMVERWIMNDTILQGITIEEEKYKRLLDMAEEVLGMQNVMIAIIVGIAAIILGLTGFSWLHSKKKVDFYHSIPVRRELLFAVKYLDGILIVFSMYLLNLILVCGVFAVNGLGIGETFLPGIITLLVHLVNYVLMYTVVLTAVVMTGNFFISILGTIVFYSYVPLFISLLMGLSYMFFETTSYSNSFWTNIMDHGSPVSYYSKILSEGNDLVMGQYYQILPKLVFPVFVALCLLLFCLLLYRWRPSEAAGKAMAFKLTKAPIKILLVVPFTIAMGLFFWNVYYSLGWAAFGFLLGLVITHCIIEIIYHFDFRKLFSHLPHMAVCGALALAVIGIYRFDLVGYDRYLPSEKQFATASMKCEGLKDWVDYGIPVKDEDDMRWSYVSQNNYVRNNMNLTDYGTVRAIAEAGIANAKESKEQKFKDMYYYGSESQDGYWTDVELTWQLKNGRTVSRRYFVDVNSLREEFDRMYTTEEYKRGTYPVLSYNNENLTGLYSLRNYRIQEVKAGEALRGEILAAYREELMDLTLEERSKETPAAALRFLTIAEREYISQISIQRNPEFTGEFRLSDMRNVNFFPVYPSFTKTITLLKEAGLDVTEKTDVTDVEKVEVYSRRKITRSAEKNDGTVQAETVEDIDIYYESIDANTIVFKNDTEEHRMQISQILDSAIPQDMAAMNGLQKYEYGVEVRVYLNSMNDSLDSDSQEYDGYYFAWNKMPEFINDLIQYDDSVYKNINYGLNVEED